MQIKPINVEKEINELGKGLTLIGIEHHELTLNKFKKYLEILDECKNRFHLLSHQDYERISRRHFLVSVMALPYLTGHNSACDIGAGAGFPSVPLKIFRPDIDFTLFEASKKKAEFLKYLISRLNLTRIQIIDERAENCRVQKFDLILVKAAGKIKQLIKIIDQLIAPMGSAIFYKSHRVEDELKHAEKEMEKRNFEVQIKKLETPMEHLPLALVILRKL